MFGIFLFDDRLTHLQPLLFILFQLFAARLFSYFVFKLNKEFKIFRDSKFSYLFFFFTCLIRWIHEFARFGAAYGAAAHFLFFL